MRGEVDIGLMTPDFILWRCLHGGPLTADTLLRWEADSPLPWQELHDRNVPLLAKLTAVYGACAVLARRGPAIVGQLRFYPKIMQHLTQSPELEFCLQQQFPHGPADALARTDFPPFGTLADKTLVVHCLMTGSPQQSENPYQRQGLGTQLVRFLVDWARGYGWTAIEARAYADIPLLYAVSGCAGRTFWEKLHFRVVKTATEAALLDETDFNRAVRESAAGAGVDPGLIANKYTMRLEL